MILLAGGIIHVDSTQPQWCSIAVWQTLMLFYRNAERCTSTWNNDDDDDDDDDDSNMCLCIIYT